MNEKYETLLKALSDLDINSQRVKQLERLVIEATLAETNGFQNRAAKLLGFSARTMTNRLREYNIHGKSFRTGLARKHKAA